MITCSVLILFGCFCATRNLALSCMLSGGYFAAMSAESCFLYKVGFPLFLRISGQVMVAALVLLIVESGFQNRENIAGEAEAVYESTIAHAPKEERHDAQHESEAPEKPHKQSKDEKVRDFALREAPSVWLAYEELGIAIGQLDAKCADLRKTLELFDKPADEDPDFRALLDKRDGMEKSRNLLKQKLEQAYIQSRKFAAAPQRREFDDLRRKAIEDGEREAKSARAKYENLRSVK